MVCMATVVCQHVIAAPHQQAKSAGEGFPADILANLASALNAGKRDLTELFITATMPYFLIILVDSMGAKTNLRQMPLASYDNQYSPPQQYSAPPAQYQPATQSPAPSQYQTGNDYQQMNSYSQPPPPPPPQMNPYAPLQSYQPPPYPPMMMPSSQPPSFFTKPFPKNFFEKLNEILGAKRFKKRALLKMVRMLNENFDKIAGVQGLGAAGAFSLNNPADYRFPEYAGVPAQLGKPYEYGLKEKPMKALSPPKKCKFKLSKIFAKLQQIVSLKTALFGLSGRRRMSRLRSLFDELNERQNLGVDEADEEALDSVEDVIDSLLDEGDDSAEDDEEADPDPPASETTTPASTTTSTATSTTTSTTTTPAPTTTSTTTTAAPPAALRPPPPPYPQMLPMIPLPQYVYPLPNVAPQAEIEQPYVYPPFAYTSQQMYP